MPRQSISIGTAENTISIKASLSATISKEKPGMYLSYCPALDLCSQGKTLREAKKNIIEASVLLIEDCFERGTLDEVLKDCGFRSTRQRPRVKKSKATSAAPNTNPRQVIFPVNFPLAYR